MTDRLHSRIYSGQNAWRTSGKWPKRFGWRVDCPWLTKVCDDGNQFANEDIRVIVFGYEAHRTKAPAYLALVEPQKSPNDGWNRLEGSVGVPEPENLATSFETSVKVDEHPCGNSNLAGNCLFKIHARIDYPLADLELVKPRATRRRHDCAKLCDSILENKK